MREAFVALVLMSIVLISWDLGWWWLSVTVAALAIIEATDERKN